MKAKKQNLKNLVTAGIISLPLILGNPFSKAKAQERYDAKYNTLAHKMVKIEQRYRYGHCYAPKKKLLDDLIDESKDYIPQKKEYTTKEAKNILKKIHNHIPKKDKNAYNLQDVCYRHSLMILSVARANNLPVYLIEAPNHVLLRWDSDGKHDVLFPNAPENKGDFNFETISGIAHNDNEIHGVKYSLTDLDQEPIRKGMYLKNLTDSQSLAFAYLKGTRMYRNVDKHEKSLELIKKAKELSPKSPNIQFSLAYTQELLGQYDKAIKNYKKILEVNPYIKDKKPLGNRFIGNTYLGVRDCLRKKGQPEEAEKYEDMGDEHISSMKYLKMFRP